MKRYRIDIVTTARADFSYVLPVAVAAAAHPALDARLIACGSTADDLADSPCPLISIPATGLGKSFAQSGIAVGEMLGQLTTLWAASSPDMVVIPADRFEILGPATAATLLNLHIAHLWGGELDIAYAIDTRVRNALTKLAHLHFVMHEGAALRLRQMGEEPWRIVVCGSSSIGTQSSDPSAFLDFAREQGWGSGPFIAATYLPLTTFPENTLDELESLISVLTQLNGYTVIWSSSNTDPGAQPVANRILRLCREHHNHFFIETLGRKRYFGLLSCAEIMVGNSSSGLVETPSFGLPTVNIGVRQIGRLGGDNVLHVPGKAKAIARAINKALHDQAFRMTARSSPHFGRADAADVIVAKIVDFLGQSPLQTYIKRGVKGNPRRIAGLKRAPDYPTIVTGN